MSIVVKNLTYIYDEGMPFASKALDNISFEIKDRDFVVMKYVNTKQSNEN